LRIDVPRRQVPLAGSSVLRPRIVFLGSLLGLAGIGLLVAGVATTYVVLGIVGFLAMFAGVMLAISRPKRSEAPQAPGTAQPAKKKSDGGFMSKLEDRWDNRRDDHGQ